MIKMHNIYPCDGVYQITIVGTWHASKENLGHPHFAWNYWKYTDPLTPLENLNFYLTLFLFLFHTLFGHKKKHEKNKT